MSLFNGTNIIRVATIILVFFSSNIFSENNTHSDSDYFELCNIYKSVVNKQIDVTSKEMKLTEKVEKKLPKLFNNLYVFVLNTDADSRYEFIQKFAKLRDRYAWECEDARLYYTTQFKAH